MRRRARHRLEGQGIARTCLEFCCNDKVSFSNGTFYWAYSYQYHKLELLALGRPGAAPVGIASAMIGEGGPSPENFIMNLQIVGILAARMWANLLAWPSYSAYVAPNLPTWRTIAVRNRP